MMNHANGWMNEWSGQRPVALPTDKRISRAPTGRRDRQIVEEIVRCPPY